MGTKDAKETTRQSDVTPIETSSRDTQRVASNQDRARSLGLGSSGSSAPSPPQVCPVEWRIQHQTGDQEPLDQLGRVRLLDTVWITARIPTPGPPLEPEDVVFETAIPGFGQGPMEWVDGAFRVPLYPTAIGPYDGLVSITVATQDCLATEQVRLAGSIEMDEARFHRRCQLATASINALYPLLHAGARNLTAAYTTAFEGHNAVLDGVRDRRRLAADLLLAAAIAFGAGATGGLAGAALANLAIGAVLVDGLKDVAKLGFEGTVSGFAAQLDTQLGDVPLEPSSPREWGDIVANNISIEQHIAHAMIRDWLNRAQGTASSQPTEGDFLLDFDPSEAMGRLTIHGVSAVLAAEALCADPAASATAFELAMWARWVQTHAFELVLHGPAVGPPPTAYVEDQVPQAVKDRLEALGESPDAFLLQHGATRREAAEERRIEHNRDLPWGMPR